MAAVSAAGFRCEVRRFLAYSDMPDIEKTQHSANVELVMWVISSKLRIADEGLVWTACQDSFSGSQFIMGAETRKESAF